MSKENSLTIEQLAHLNPFRDQDQALLSTIREMAESFELDPGSVLFEIDEIDFYTYYLLQGQMELVTRDGRSKTLEGGDESARNPISTLIPRQYQATAKTTARVVRFNTDKLNLTLYGDRQTGHIASPEIEDDLSETGEFEGEIFSEIYRGISEGNLYMAPLPASVIRVLNLSNNDEVSQYQLEMALQHDPDIVETIIKIANCDLYQAESPATDLHTAVEIIGTSQVLLWVLSISMKPMFSARTNRMIKHMANVWILSALVASTAAILSKRTGLFNPARSFLCALMQDIGEIPIYRYLEQSDHSSAREHRIQKAVNDLRGEIGALILDKWSFPENCHIVAREVENWNRDNSNLPDMTDLVMISKLHAYLQFPTNKPIPAMYKLPAFKKIGLRAYTPQMGKEIIEEAKAKLIHVFGFFPDVKSS